MPPPPSSVPSTPRALPLRGLSGRFGRVRQWTARALRRLPAHKALQTEAAFRRAMEDAMTIGLRVLDLQGRITYVNAAFCQMTGWREDELLGQCAPFKFWPDENRALYATYLARELAGKADPHRGLQVSLKQKSGNLIDARIHVSPMLDSRGRQTGWLATIANITGPANVRRELAAAQERFVTVLGALDAAVSVAALGSAELLYANQQYRAWFGADTDGHLILLERAGAIRETAPPDLDGHEPGNLAGDPPGGQAEVHVERLGRWLEVRSRYLTWVDGRLAQMVIATDITARHQAEEQAAVQAERAQTASRLITMGEMASSVAHELGQPLTAISNYCHGIMARVKSGRMGQDDLLAALEKTARQAQRAGQVIGHIRGFVKRSEPHRQRVEAAVIVEQVAELADIALRRRQVRLVWRLADDLPPLFADPILIEQVLLNLIKNGAESIDAAGREPQTRRVDLRVDADPLDDLAAARFTVSDTGNGLSAQVQKRLYETFFSTKSDGLGIGLSLCRSIVESHQGRILAENLYNARRDIVGCRFSFWIPALPPTQTPDT